ncbi:MAG: hypothetical protein ACREUY_01165 [Burkholderiales bacterium]
MNAAPEPMQNAMRQHAYGCACACVVRNIAIASPSSGDGHVCDQRACGAD